MIGFYAVSPSPGAISAGLPAHGSNHLTFLIPESELDEGSIGSRLSSLLAILGLFRLFQGHRLAFGEEQSLWPAGRDRVRT